MRHPPTTHQPLVFCLFAAVFGILLDRYLAVYLSVWILFGGVALGGWVILQYVLYRQFYEKQKLYQLELIPAVMLLVAVAAVYGGWHHTIWHDFNRDDIGFAASPSPAPICLEGVITDTPHFLIHSPNRNDVLRVIQQTDVTSFRLRVTQVRSGITWQKRSGNVAVSVNGIPESLQFGDTVRIFGNFSLPAAPMNPADKDVREVLRANHILTVLRVDSPEQITPVATARWFSPRVILHKIRVAARRQLTTTFHGQNAAFIQAMLLGVRDDIDEEDSQLLLETGTMHVLSISGLHIGLIAASVFFFMRLCGISRRRAAMTVAIVLLGYLFLTDMRAPAVRATTLFWIVAAALMFGRQTHGLQSLVVTAMVVLMWNPTSLFFFGPQLSFLAASAFLWTPRQLYCKRKHLAPSVSAGFDRLNPALTLWANASLLRLVYGAFRVSGTIWLISTPLLLHEIHLFTPVAILVNPLLWLPLTGLLLSGIAAMTIGWISPELAWGIGIIGNGCCQSFLTILHVFHSIPYGYLWVCGPTTLFLCLFYGPYLYWTIFPRHRPSFRILACLIVLWIVAGYGWQMTPRLWNRLWGQTTVILCAVGHGNSTILLTPDGKTILVDAGCFSHPKRGAAVVSRTLWRWGITRIDTVVLSHPDADHYNSVPFLVDQFHIGAVVVTPLFFEDTSGGVALLREKLETHSIPIHTVVADDTIPITTDTTVSLTVLHPTLPQQEEGMTASRDSASNNSNSMVVLFQHGPHRLLLPGDLDSFVKPPFLMTPLREHGSDTVPMIAEPMAKTKILLELPHHGGNSKMTEPLLQWCHTEEGIAPVLFVSAGAFTYNPDKLQALRSRGFEVYCTFESGETSIFLTTGRVKIKTFRQFDYGSPVSTGNK